MKNLFLIPMCIFGLTGLANAGIGLIEPSELLQKQKTKRLILDTRGGYKDYISGHIPDARHINFDTLRGTDSKGVPVQYLADDLSKRLLKMAGVDKNQEHILYAEGGTGDEILSASMMAYVLEKHGIENIKILNGGLPEYKKWNALSQDYPIVAEGKIPNKTKHNMAIAVAELVKVKDQQQTLLIDARPENEYLGQDNIWPRKGHIPGAINLPWRKVMEVKNTHRFMPLEQAQSLFNELGIDKNKNIIVYCGTSREGSLLYFYFKHIAQYPNVRLYEGSWKEYSNLKELAVETKMSMPKKNI